MDNSMRYQGIDYPLIFIREPNRKRNKLFFYDSKFFYYVRTDFSVQEIKKELERWYREKARDRIEARTKFYAQNMQVSYENIRIKDQRSCWGSCSSKRNLNFNWRLILAPEQAMNYVILHELCHLLEMNHSKAFWNLVAEQMPEYRIWKKWLKDHGLELSRYLE